MRRRQSTNLPDRLDTVDAGQHHVHKHRVERAVSNSFRGGLAASDEFGLVTEFAQDGVEHDPAEGIVLDAKDSQARLRPGIVGKPALRFERLGSPQRHREGQRGAATAALRGHDISPHRARQLLDRGQTEPGAAEARRDAHIGLRERAEQPLDLLQRQSDPTIGYREADADPALSGARRQNLQGNTAALGELHRVVDQVLERCTKADRIADHERRQARGDLDLRLQPLGRRAPGQRVAGVLRERAQVEQILAQSDRAVGVLGGVDKQRRKARKVLRAGLDGVDPAPFALAEF